MSVIGIISGDAVYVRMLELELSAAGFASRRGARGAKLCVFDADSTAAPPQPPYVMISRAYPDKPLPSNVSFLRRPFLSEELQERISELLLALGDDDGIELDDSAAQITLGDKLFKLTRAEYSLLRLLYDAGGEPVARETAALEVFDGRDSNIVDVYIYYLREKLGRDMIKTVRGRGYSFCGGKIER